jgi:2-C-methyl-D-erythritol 4-phosphate cytidylyltransferase
VPTRGPQNTSVAGVVVAAGRGIRFGDPRPKALLETAGTPLVVHAVRALREAGIASVVVVHPPDEAASFRAALDGYDVELVPGGASRTDSVRAGVAAVDPTYEVVAVHDAARPLVPSSIVAQAVMAVSGDVLAAAPAIAVADTLKRVGSDQEVVGTVDREALRGVQTPQVFPRWVLEKVLAGPHAATDELALVEQAIAGGHLHGRVVVVEGSVFGMKVTYPDDLRVIQALAQLPDEETT